MDLGSSPLSQRIFHDSPPTNPSGDTKGGVTFLRSDVPLQPQRLRMASAAVGCKRLLRALMMNDVEVFIGCWRLEVCGDGIKLGVRGPSRASGQPLASFSELPLADII
jgi:hypothetical protein